MVNFKNGKCSKILNISCLPKRHRTNSADLIRLLLENIFHTEREVGKGFSKCSKTLKASCLLKRP